ncbi:MAG TPA: SDR family oxidoreductase [Bdellovibrionota bacterium]|jgi:NAD(P)-dependent dehydrogenase (short-subunit alcohol dehydrogenase family)|nr:SDR family oxidoreductase [Bdellovibrionota bacterium]
MWYGAQMDARPPEGISPQDLLRCFEVLETIASDGHVLARLNEDDRVRLMMAAGRLIHPEQAEARRRVKAKRSFKKQQLEAKDRVVRAATHIRAARRDAVFVAPERRLIGPGAGAEPVVELERPRDCYVCKTSFTRVHFFYDAMCPDCGALNYEKRFQTAPLDGRVALITGARLKIGYQAALMLLRAGARVVVTTRFPHDAAQRFARENDFGVWGDRLQVHGLDLRHSPSVEVFTQLMERRLDRLDILINNAAQTVRRPPGFYKHMVDLESAPIETLTEGARKILAQHAELRRELTGSPDLGWLSEWHGIADRTRVARPSGQPSTLGITESAALSQIPYKCDDGTEQYFPEGRLDADLQQVDHRAMNSWRMRLSDVPTAELLEVQLVNSVAPFILCSKLKPLMLRDRTGEKHIVNVSAVEGQFARHTKTDKHPHTNMAKAALNMMTLTSARDYVRDGIHMNAVDTGWVTDEDPAAISARKQAEHDFQPPLDIVDGAARVCDPIFSGLLTGQHSWGNFFKDYRPVAW